MLDSKIYNLQIWYDYMFAVWKSSSEKEDEDIVKPICWSTVVIDSATLVYFLIPLSDSLIVSKGVGSQRHLDEYTPFLNLVWVSRSLIFLSGLFGPTLVLFGLWHY